MIKGILAGGLMLAASVGSAMAATEITWWHAMGGGLGETVNLIASNFNASQDEVELTPVFKGSYEEALTAGIAAFRGGEQPNILQVFDAGSATIIGAKGAVIPVQDLLEQSGADFNIEDYISGVRYFYSDSEGKMIGMPFNSSSPIMYYNIEAFEKAGVDLPKSWEDFEAIAPALKDAGYTPLVQSHLPWEFTENFFSRNNLPFASNNNGYDGAKGTKLLVNTDPLKMMFSKLLEWRENGLFEFYGTSWGDNQTPFEQGDVALWIGSSGSFGGLRQTATMPFGAIPLPFWKSIAGDEGYQSFIGGAALFAMSGKSDEENMATAKFFQYMSSPEVQLLWHKRSGYVPITIAAYELAKAEGYYEETPQAEVGIQQLNLRSGEWTKGYRMGFYVQIRDVMNREYGKLFSGETTIDDAFSTIEADSNKLLERFARTNG